MRLAERAGNISPSPTLSIDAQAKKMIAEGIKVINFGVGEPDFDTPENIKQAAIKAIRNGMTKYTPVAGTDALRRAIVKKLAEDNGLNYEPAQIVVSAGAKHSLYNAFQVLCQEGDEVILPAPYWVSYLEQIKLAGAKPVIVPTRLENNFKLTPGELQSAITPNTRVIIINSPSNPTGAVYTREELAALGEVLVKHNIVIISDEIYEKLIYDGNEHVSIASLSPALKELTVVINGVSKSHAMTGWRIGYAAAPQPVAKAMADLQSHSTSNPTSIAQAASVEALEGTQESLKRMVAEFVKRRDYMVERLNAIPGVKCNRPGGAFYVFPEIKSLLGRSYAGVKINGAADLAGVLLEKMHVAIVPGVAFGDDTCFRLSYATSMDNIKEGLDRIEKVLTSLE
ncbi:pyridoxal phosphate-dependent aminotransferase [Desulfallas sp. Bu1-1]|uniref:pyridoxal phosphate-dependent aminotransferase n=1 Tax=Desulfallas sp. Bu1-1 TaxID=2787620 RepID=UPI00189CF8B4|nr:pyridoxal phosphate-dependent aminotransferase [Desulfallas sp. Bu1-1]MBF7082310.1 pyridoxal phosphate-dependent aminotransferase [Desulfallas sp. Bu1-1]